MMGSRPRPLRILSAILTVCLLLGCAPVSALSKNTAASRFRTSVVSGGIRIDGLSRGEKRLVIPAFIDGLPVVALKPSAFARSAKLVSAILPGGIETVSERAFAGCAKLQEAHLMEGVAEIGALAFARCRKLARLTVPKSLVVIDPSAFTAGMNVTLCGYAGSYAEAFVRDYAGSAKLTFRAVRDGEPSVIYVDGCNTLAVGETIALSADEIFGEDGIGAVWTSSKPAVAAVDAAGRVTGIKAGAAVITAAAGGFVARHEVKVTAADAYTAERIERIFAEPASKTPIGPLAQLSIVMADTVYDKNEGAKSFRMLGFKDIYDYNYPDPTADHGVAFMLAKRPVVVGNRRYTLYAAILRGTMDSGKEWLSNAEIGSGGTHRGFQIAGDEVCEKLLALIGDADKKTVKIWVAGFSRGASVTNYVSKKLWDMGYNTGNLYGYAFACPTLTTTPDSAVTVFNYNIDDDFVPKLPPISWGYARHGTSFFLKDGTAMHEKMKACYKKLTKETYSALTGAQSDQLVKFFADTLSREKFISAISYLRTRAPKETANLIESLWKGKSGSFVKAAVALIAKLLVGGEAVDETAGGVVQWIRDLLALIKMLYGSGGKIMNAHDGVVYHSWMVAQYGG